MQDPERKKLRAIIDSCRDNPNPEKLAEEVEKLSIDHYFTDKKHVSEAFEDYQLLIEQCQKPKDDDARLILAILHFHRANQLCDENQPELAKKKINRGCRTAEDYFVESLCNDRIQGFEDVKMTLQIYDVTYRGFGDFVLVPIVESLYDRFLIAEMFTDPGVEDTT